MLTRRTASLSLLASCFARAATAQAALLTIQQRQSILEIRALAENDAARYGAYAPLFARAARETAAAEPALSRALARVNALFSGAAAALTAGARAIPAHLPAAPAVAPQAQAQGVGGVLRGPALTTPEEGAPASPPATTVRVTPAIRPPAITAPIAAVITPEPRTLTSGVIYQEANAGVAAWRRVAEGFRAIAARTGLALSPPAGQFELASSRLQDAVLQLVRARFADAVRDAEAGDRVGNFQIQDLVSRANQNETLASSVRRKLDDTSDDLIRNIGG